METPGNASHRSVDTQSEWEALKESLNETETMLHFGSWSHDINSGTLTWSKGMYALMGYQPSEIKDSLPFDFWTDHIAEDDRSSFRNAYDQAIADKTDFEFSYSMINKKNEELSVYTTGKIAAGQRLKLAGVTRNITRERDAEQKLEEKVKELDRSNKDLEEFAYIASHDLQEPLRKITSFSERLKEKLGQEIGKENLFYLNRMLAATDNMRSLIDNLLEFSRTSRNAQAFEKTDLRILLDNVTSDLELKIEETGAVVEATNLPELTAIPSQLRQLFTNLITNAIKFKKPDTPPHIVINGKKLSKEEKEQYRLRASKTWYIFSVKDNGIGFEQEYAYKIFQIFQRLHGKSEYPGSGIGLAICKKIVENHKGIIFAQGELEAGAEFTFILPESQN